MTVCSTSACVRPASSAGRRARQESRSRRTSSSSPCRKRRSSPAIVRACGVVRSRGTRRRHGWPGCSSASSAGRIRAFASAICARWASSPRGSAAISPLAMGSPSRRTVAPAGSHRHSSAFATEAQWTMRCSRPDTSRIADSVRHSRRLSASHRDGRPRATASDSPGSTRQWGRWLPAPPMAGFACSSSPIGGCSRTNSSC